MGSGRGTTKLKGGTSEALSLQKGGGAHNILAMLSGGGRTSFGVVVVAVLKGE